MEVLTRSRGDDNITVWLRQVHVAREWLKLEDVAVVT